MHECKYFFFSVHHPNSIALCLYVGLQDGNFGFSPHMNLHFLKVHLYTCMWGHKDIMYAQYLKSKYSICCCAVLQHFLISLLSAIYCIFKSGQKGDLPGIFHCGFATQFPLKLSM